MKTRTNLSHLYMNLKKNWPIQPKTQNGNISSIPRHTMNFWNTSLKYRTNLRAFKISNKLWQKSTKRLDFSMMKFNNLRRDRCKWRKSCRNCQNSSIMLLKERSKRSDFTQNNQFKTQRNGSRTSVTNKRQKKNIKVKS